MFHSYLRISCSILLLGCSVDNRTILEPSAGRADPGGAVVVAWNERLVGIAGAEDQFLTLKGARALAMMHLAMHDAINGVDARYATYARAGATRQADPVVAAAQAAHDVVLAAYPGQAEQLRAELGFWLDTVADGGTKTASQELGHEAAAALEMSRRDDRYDAAGEYHPQAPAPGVYVTFPEHSGTPPDFVFGAGWGAAKPFFLQHAAQFRAAPPPAVDSDAYAEAFREVKEVGRFESPLRTRDQTHLAYWWKEFAESSMNRLARQLVTSAELDLWRSARLLALVNGALFDGYVGSFESKFHYQHWRPFTAIRAAASDGNAKTEPDPDWNNTHRHTYPFPSYPSAHGTVCAAALGTLAGVLGPARTFEMTTRQVSAAGPLSAQMTLDPAERRFESFATAAEECAASRVYLGIHFRYDSDAGNELGSNIAAYASSNFLEPRPARAQ